MAARLNRLFSRPQYLVAPASVAVVFSAYALNQNGASSSKTVDIGADPMLRSSSIGSLIGTWIVYKSCRFLRKSIVHTGSIPGLRELSHLVIRHTFFKQFVGGDTAEDCIPVMRRLRDVNIGCMLTYSVEEESAEQSDEHGTLDLIRANVQEAIRSIQVAGEENRKVTPAGQIGSTWVAVKLTGMTDPEILRRASDLILQQRKEESKKGSAQPSVPYPGSPTDLELARYMAQDQTSLSASDLARLRVLHADMRHILTVARDEGVRIIIDSEQSWYQPATDVMQMILSNEFNKLPSPSDSNAPAVFPLLYGTFQCYLQRNIPHLRQSLQHARENGYCLGAKLVRGAYREQELQHWINTGKEGIAPVWANKAETDACYNECLDIVVDEIAKDKDSTSPRVGLILATHNQKSAERLIEKMKENGLARSTVNGVEVDALVRKRIIIAQLYGMNDSMTSWLSHVFAPNGEPMVLNYVPYGALAEVMPYLSRRAVENKSVLGGETGAKFEATRVWGEMKRRMNSLG